MDSFCGVADLKEEESSASKIGCNAVVLRSIARASDFSTLKSLRQVNSFLAQAVSRVFTQRASVNLKPGSRSLKSLRSFAKDTKGIGRKLKVLKINCESEVKNKLKEAIAFNDILQTLSPFLETLDLVPLNSKFITLFNPRIASKGQFPVLRTLVLDNDDLNILRIVPKLFEATPALENLELSRLSYLYDPEASFVLSPLQIRGEDGSIRRNWNLAPKLRSLTVWMSLSRFEAESLTLFPQTWDALTLCWNSSHEPGPVATALGQLFEENKDSLRRLTLHDVLFEVEPEVKVQLQLPSSFSKLRFLRFYFEGRDFEHISFCFGRAAGLGEYAKMCQNLELICIVVYLKAETKLESIWSKFFPQTVSREGGTCLNWFVEREGKKVVVAGRGVR